MLIFLPNKSGANPQHLVAAGLQSLFSKSDDAPDCTDLITAGPGGMHGQVWGWLGTGTEQLGFLASQTWIEGDSGQYWIGWEPDYAPSPENLARRDPCNGRMIPLGDGRMWRIPSAADLPRTAKLKNGQWDWQPESRFTGFVERSAWAFDVAYRCLAEQSREIPLEAIPYALEVLNINYRMVPEIADQLGLFTPSALLTLLAAATDFDKLCEIEAQLKKGGAVPTPSG